MNSDFKLPTASAETGEARKTLPPVSVIIPVYNEEKFIARCLSGVLEQDYPADKLEIIIADGFSTDKTREIVASFQQKHRNIRLIENPKRIVPTGLNRAIACARGEIVVRLDGHCEYPRNYVRRVVELREQTGADNLGGVLVPVGATYVQKAIAAAYYSPVGLGGAALKASSGSGLLREVDAVHGGCWKRTRLLEIGGFDEEMVRNQDDELSFRLRKNQGKIFQTLSLRVIYHVRSSYRNLFRQFAQYGYWKVHVIRKHPRQASLRHLAPAAFICTLLCAALIAPFSLGALLIFALLVAAYLGTLGIASLAQTWREIKFLPGIIAALVCMQMGYGLGFLIGCIRVSWPNFSDQRVFAESTR
jgi:glycosyltransferase involved in cell wall biosynthesis